jgi:hypothetical protein
MNQYFFRNSHIKKLHFILCFLCYILIGCNRSQLPTQNGLAGLPFLDNSDTRSISAENMTGEKGGGGMAIPNLQEPFPAASARAADSLGQGWNKKGKYQLLDDDIASVAYWYQTEPHNPFQALLPLEKRRPIKKIDSPK